jgi:hypothetical protein
MSAERSKILFWEKFLSGSLVSEDMHVLRVDGRDGDHLPLAAVLTKY